MNPNPELIKQLLKAKSPEEVQAILGDKVDAEELSALLDALEKTPKEAVTALDDDDLDNVSGGLAFEGGFSLNAWLGGLLRELLKKNSAGKAGDLLYRGESATPSDLLYRGESVKASDLLQRGSAGKPEDLLYRGGGSKLTLL